MRGRPRGEATLPERVVWGLLRDRRAFGLKFRRQHPIGRWTVDFACPALKLVVELDGGVHRLPEVAARDAVRQAALEALGWTVLRFDNEAVLNRPDLLLAAIEARLPSPPVRGRGGGG